MVYTVEEDSLAIHEEPTNICIFVASKQLMTHCDVAVAPCEKPAARPERKVRR